VVLEAQDQPGRSGALCRGDRAGFVSDLFSSFYPLGYASPAIAALQLEAHGLEWRHAPAVLGHPTRDGRCALLSRDLDETATSLDTYAAGDGAAWRRMFARWQLVRDPLIDACSRRSRRCVPGCASPRHSGWPAASASRASR
jgi:phytoene dehydrogenase-like protein